MLTAFHAIIALYRYCHIKLPLGFCIKYVHLTINFANGLFHRLWLQFLKSPSPC